jgi:hypothetical protein
MRMFSATRWPASPREVCIGDLMYRVYQGVMTLSFRSRTALLPTASSAPRSWPSFSAQSACP